MKVKIVYNERKEWAGRVAAECREFVQGKNHSVVEKGEDIAVIIGGDGTIFYHKDSVSGAIFGIGGQQSKVCQANERNWKQLLEKALRKPVFEERTALSVSVGRKFAGWVINDAVVHARRHNFVEIRLKTMGKTYEFGGDGVIVATPTGASGYAYSAGGFVIDRNYRVVEVVAICPYMRSFKPLLVPVLAPIEIRHEGACDLVLDGQKITELGEGDVVRVEADRNVLFVSV